MEFKQNYQTGKMDPLGTPLPIASYFPGPGGPTAPFPLSMNYMTPDPATNNATYLLNMIGPVGFFVIFLMLNLYIEVLSFLLITVVEPKSPDLQYGSRQATDHSRYLSGGR